MKRHNIDKRRSNLVLHFDQKMALFEPQIAKTIFKSLEIQTRQLLHADLGPEYEFYVKIQNIVKIRSNPGQFCQK